jgi:hypothetical protein
LQHSVCLPQTRSRSRDMIDVTTRLTFSSFLVVSVHHIQLDLTMRFYRYLILGIPTIHAFLIHPRLQQTPTGSALFARDEAEVTIAIEASLDEEKVTKLFAWISRALSGDGRYNDLMSALAAVFGNVPALQPLMDHAMAMSPREEELAGVSLGLAQREEASLGAMGAAQWMGIWKTRPHALLDIRKFEHVDDWVATLPRGCKRTLKKSLAQNFTVTTKHIRPGQPAPHSSLAHFRCVVEHEIRLLAYSPQEFFDALAEAVSRYMGTTRMVGEIQEYRDAETNRVLAFAHEVRKGNTIRGQWFYGTDEASKRYVWFHSVHELVRRAIASDGIHIVDLGPSGSDAFSELKAKYGFISVDDWPSVADYTGPFWYSDDATQ